MGNFFLSNHKSTYFPMTKRCAKMMTYNKQVLHAVRQIISKAHLVLLLKSMLHIQFIIYLVFLASKTKAVMAILCVWAFRMCSLSPLECYCSSMHHPLLFMQPGEFDRYRVGYLSTRANAKHSHLWNLYWLKSKSRVSSGKVFASSKHFGLLLSP